MKHVILIAVLFASSLAFAKKKDLDSDMDALGGNQDLMERANAIDPRNTTRVIQKREVDRNSRLELGLNYSTVAGGDPYVDTNNLGARLEFHADPHWSFGARYYHSFNALNSEGQHAFDHYNGGTGPRPDVDYAINTYMGTVSFYPFYGKINFADLAIKQFDIYFMAGGGAVALDQGTKPMYTAGIGFAFWWSNHWSTRLEGRYEGFQDKFYDDNTSRQMNLTIFTLDVGYLL